MRLHRIRSLLGNDSMARLHGATVMVVGCGAVGSFAIEALARSGIGHLIIVDFDNVEESNINRQLFALDSTLSRPKVDVAAMRIRDINPGIQVTALNMFWDDDSDITITPDFVIDAIDSIDSKIALYQWCLARHVPFISSMGAARKTDIAQIRTSTIYKTNTCPLASRVRKLAREHDLPDFPVVYSAEPPSPQPAGAPLGSIITVTGVFGLLMADYAIKEITK